MNKDEMIKELEKEQPIAMMIQRYLNNNNIKVSHPLLPMHIEEMLTRKNYRKVADDEIVVTKRQYEQLKKHNTDRKRLRYKWQTAEREAEYWKSRCNEIGDVASKETAREILQELKNKQIFMLADEVFGRNTVITQNINELANKYGIELE